MVMFPVGFVVWAWVAGGGYPFFMDSNESAASYVHALNMRRFQLSETLFLTVQDLGPSTDVPRDVYSHNPNLPRFAHYALLMLGIESMTTQILLVAAAATLTAMLIVVKLAESWEPTSGLALLVPLAVALDSMGFLTWAVNTYRVFAFVLMWGAMLVVVRRGPPWAACVLGVCVFYFEYAFAVYVSVAMASVAILRDGMGARRTLVPFGIGGMLSLALFGAQVLGYYGAEGAWDEIARTATRRGVTIDLGTALGNAASELATRYGSVVAGLVAWSLATVPLVLLSRLRHRASPLRLGLAQLQLGLVLGILATATVLRGYFVDGYVAHFLPCLAFVIPVGMATVGLDVAAAVGRVRQPLPIVAAWVLVAGVMAANFERVFVRYPQVAGDLAPILANDFRGLPFVARPYWAHFTFALTGVPGSVGPEDLRAEDLRSYERLRTADGRLFYLCIDVWTRRREVCDRAEVVYLPRHTIAARGRDWTIFELRR